jgi:hypothetical protein
MAQYQNSELPYLFDSLALYRAKYLELLTEGSPEEELTHCEKAIQFYLSVIIMMTNSKKRNKHFTFSFKSMLRRLSSLMKAKPSPESLQTI